MKPSCRLSLPPRRRRCCIACCVAWPRLCFDRCASYSFCCRGSCGCSQALPLGEVRETHKGERERCREHRLRQRVTVGAHSNRALLCAVRQVKCPSCSTVPFGSRSRCCSICSWWSPSSCTRHWMQPTRACCVGHSVTCRNQSASDERKSHWRKPRVSIDGSALHWSSTNYVDTPRGKLRVMAQTAIFECCDPCRPSCRNSDKTQTGVDCCSTSRRFCIGSSATSTTKRCTRTAITVPNSRSKISTVKWSVRCPRCACANGIAPVVCTAVLT